VSPSAQRPCSASRKPMHINPEMHPNFPVSRGRVRFHIRMPICFHRGTSHTPPPSENSESRKKQTHISIFFNPAHPPTGEYPQTPYPPPSHTTNKHRNPRQPAKPSPANIVPPVLPPSLQRRRQRLALSDRASATANTIHTLCRGAD